MAEWLKDVSKENLLAKTDSAASFNNKKSEAFKQARDRLSQLAVLLQKEEEKLYTSLGVRDLNQLQKKIYALNADYGFRSMVNMKDSDFDNLVLGAAEGVDLTKPITFTVGKEAAENGYLAQLAKDLGNQQATNFIEQFSSQAGKRSAFSGMHLTGSRGIAKKIASYSVFWDNDQLRFQVTLNEKTSKSELNKFAERLGASLDGSSGEIRSRLQQSVLSLIKNEDIKRLVQEEFSTRDDWYDVNSSKASIKGYLGEVHANVMMRYLFGNAQVYATGNIRDLKGQEIPIDLVVNSIGFQIKNYQIKKGKTLFRYSNSAGYFVENRVRPKQSLQNLLVSLFGMYQYYGDDPDFVSAVEARLANDGSVAKIFNAHMDNIMRISDAFGARNNEQELFLGEQTYYNTFFLISDKLVPSSAIVWAIHDELGAVGEKILTTEWKFSKPIADSIGKSAKSPNLLADKIKVEAFLYLDVANVLQKARRAAERQGV